MDVFFFFTMIWAIHHWIWVGPGAKMQSVDLANLKIFGCPKQRCNISHYFAPGPCSGLKKVIGSGIIQYGCS